MFVTKPHGHSIDVTDDLDSVKGNIPLFNFCISKFTEKKSNPLPLDFLKSFEPFLQENKIEKITKLTSQNNNKFALYFWFYNYKDYSPVIKSQLKSCKYDKKISNFKKIIK